MWGPYNITEDYRVMADSLSYVLQKKRIVKDGKNKGEEAWDNEGYFGRIDHLLNRILNLELMEHLGDMKLAVERIDAIEEHLYILIKIKKEREASWS